jgi:UDP-N-acetyl-D-glucosamine/UDP-N-acetyl-D-galactosamine dehydrogenase
MNEIKPCVIGLGYVGLPVAIALSKKNPGTIGFDISRSRVSELTSGKDRNGDVPDSEIDPGSIVFSAEESDLSGCNFFVVAVPTPIDKMKRPDLSPLVKASELVGRNIRKGSTVVYESTVYPGVTEEICGPIIEKISGLKQGKDFFLGYSPERINPGDLEHRFETITKVVSGDTPATCDLVAKVYESIVDAGVYRASSIKVAEAAKVIENTQRDLNIALMNELAIIFDRMGIPSKEVFDAAATKWNFLRFQPGLVGGHCIGVDPYYLTTKAEELGYRPQVILSGRRINDGMGSFIAQKAIKLMITNEIKVKGARVGVLGLTFKENVSDIRNSRIPDILNELHEFGITPIVFDPIADRNQVAEEFNIEMADFNTFTSLDCLILAVPHSSFVKEGATRFTEMLSERGILIDVKGAFSDKCNEMPHSYWSL